MTQQRQQQRRRGQAGRHPWQRCPPPLGAQVLPCATYYDRQGYPLKKICKVC